MDELQRFCLFELQPKEEQLLKKLHSYLRGSVEQAEQGFEIMSDALDNVGFENFLKKVNPSLYTDCLLSNEIDIVNATLNFLILVSEADEIAEHVVKHDNSLSDKLIPLLSNEETTTATLHVINGFILVAEKLDRALPRTPRNDSVNYTTISQFINLIPILNNHLQAYDSVKMPSYQCLTHILRNPNAKPIFLRENGAERIVDLISDGNDHAIAGCFLINILLSNEEEHNRDTFNLILLKSNIISVLLGVLNTEVVGDCLKTLRLMAESKVVVNSIASSPNILALIDCLKFPPQEPYTSQSLKDAIEIMALLVQNKNVIVRLREVGFTLVISELLSNFMELDDRTQLLLMSILMDCVSDDYLMNELKIYNVDTVLNLISAEGIVNEIKTKLINRFENFKQRQNVMNSVQSTLEGTKEKEEVKMLEKAMDITKKRLSKPNGLDINLNGAKDELKIETLDGTDAHKIPLRTPRKSMTERKKRNAMMIKGFQLEDLAVHLGETIPKEPTLTTPRVLKSPKKEETSNVVNETEGEPKEILKKGHSDIIKINSPRNKRDPKGKTNEEISQSPTDKINLNSMRMPSIDLISAEGNQEQLKFVSQVNAQSKHRGVCVDELYESQKIFNETMNKIVNTIIPQLVKINIEHKNVFPSFEELFKFHKQLEIDLKELIEQNQNYDADIYTVIGKMLNDSEFMKVYEKYWINVEMDKARNLREHTDTAKKLKEFDKEGLVVEKLILLPMERFRRFVPIIDSFVHNTPDCCVEHDNIVKAFSDIVYLIAYFDEKRQTQQGLVKMKKLQKEVEGFDVFGVVLSDSELCVKMGKKPETLKVVVVAQENCDLKMFGIVKKKKKMSVKWQLTIDKSTSLIPMGNKITINIKDQSGKMNEIIVTFKFARECDEWYQLVLKAINNC